MNKTMDDFRSENKEQAETSIKSRLVLEAIGKDAAIEVTDEEVSSKIKEMAENYGRKEEEVKDNPELIKYVTENLKTVAQVVKDVNSSQMDFQKKKHLKDLNKMEKINWQKQKKKEL